ncbi:MAG: methyltransferase domain-containing protein [Sneathiella sp.]
MQKKAETSPHPSLFDREIVHAHRRRAALGDWSKYGFLFDEISDRLAERAQDVARKFDRVLDLGCHSGAFARHLGNYTDAGTVISADLSADMLETGDLKNAVVADEEFLPFAPASFDMIGSVLSLHWTNDLPGALIQIFRSLKPDGLFLGALFGIDSLSELKTCLTQAELEVCGGISPRISPFTDVRDAGALLQRAGFALPVSDVETITLKYRTAFDLMKELRFMGEGNALIDRQKSFTGRAVLMRAAELYAEQFADAEGLISASFQIIYLTGWSPHENQQKPLKPGSGQTSLTDLLSKK